MHFVNLKSNLYSALVNAVVCEISWYTGPRCNGTWLCIIVYPPRNSLTYENVKIANISIQRIDWFIDQMHKCKWFWKNELTLWYNFIFTFVCARACQVIVLKRATILVSLVKDCSISIAYALEMLQSSTKPSISSFSNTLSTNMFPRVSKPVLKSFKSQDLKGRPTRNIHDTSWHGHTFFIVGPLWGGPHPQRTGDVELLSCRWFEMTRCSSDINLMRQT